MNDSLTDKAKELVEAFAKLHAIRAKHANSWSQEEEDHLSAMDVLFVSMNLLDFDSLAPALDAVDSSFSGLD